MYDRAVHVWLHLSTLARPTKTKGEADGAYSAEEEDIDEGGMVTSGSSTSGVWLLQLADTVSNFPSQTGFKN